MKSGFPKVTMPKKPTFLNLPFDGPGKPGDVKTEILKVWDNEDLLCTSK
ncbi:hypothetical protein ACFL6C_10720 [Myxococcota bacterium]